MSGFSVFWMKNNRRVSISASQDWNNFESTELKFSLIRPISSQVPSQQVKNYAAVNIKQWVWQAMKTNCHALVKHSSLQNLKSVSKSCRHVIEIYRQLCSRRNTKARWRDIRISRVSKQEGAFHEKYTRNKNKDTNHNYRSHFIENMLYLLLHN